MTRRLGRGVDAAAGQERLHLGGDAQRQAVVGDVKRLDAEGIAGEEQPALLGVPDRERIHAAQPVQHRRPMAGVKREDDLGVGIGGECHALALERVAERAVIVDLAVIGDVKAAVGGCHRLGGGIGEIDDRQAPVGEPDMAVVRYPRPGAVGAAGDHRLA